MEVKPRTVPGHHIFLCSHPNISKSRQTHLRKSECKYDPAKEQSILALLATRNCNSRLTRPRVSACGYAPDALERAAILLQGPLVLGTGSVVVVNHLGQLLLRQLLILGHIHNLGIRHGSKRATEECSRGAFLSEIPPQLFPC